MSRFEPIALDGVPNFRDLGGYLTSDGRIVRHGKVFRSGMLGAATDADLATMASLGIRTVIDLRTQPEVDMFGADRLPNGVSLVPLSIPSAGADPIVEEALRSGRFPYLPDLVSVNRSYIQDDAVRLGEILELLSEPANLPAVVHCLGGKDRTGVTSALLLTILGVTWSKVREDYLRSNAYYEGTVGDRPSTLSLAMAERLGHVPDFGDEETKREFFVLQPAYIDIVLDEMTKDSRSIAEFVATELRLSDNTVQRLRSELLHRSESHTAGLHMAAQTIDSGDRER